MATPSVQGGLTPVRSLIGITIGNGNEFEILSGEGTNTFVGDPMTAVQTQSAVDGCPNAQVWAVGAHKLLGSMRSVRPTLTNLTLQYRLASILTRVNIEDNPMVTFHIKSATATTTADVFGMATMVATAGSTVTGQSGMTLNETGVTLTGTASLPLRILRTHPIIGTTVLGTGGVYEVQICNHTYIDQFGTASATL